MFYVTFCGILMRCRHGSISQTQSRDGDPLCHEHVMNERRGQYAMTNAFAAFQYRYSDSTDFEDFLNEYCNFSNPHFPILIY